MTMWEVTLTVHVEAPTAVDALETMEKSVTLPKGARMLHAKLVRDAEIVEDK